jgi:predicted nucleic acid-binding Zn ribbon protein
MSEPQHLSAVLSELIARRGLARVQGNAQIAAAWNRAAGERIASCTRVLGLNRSVLEIGVANAALMNELVSFHAATLLDKLRAEYSEQSIRDLRFRLKTDLTPTARSS